MGRKEIDEAARLTGLDVLQLSGTIGAYCAACLILAALGIRDVPMPALIAIGVIGALIKPRAWLHGPLSVIAALFLWRSGLGFLPSGPWVLLFLCGMGGRHYGRVTGDRRIAGGGMLALLTACLGILFGFPSQ